ncbi:hypothetical protein FRC18_001761 [Serendipita sp. 400]|nr:hypothetical protein FRC18_001761 [Serendipita sp. 400]
MFANLNLNVVLALLAGAALHGVQVAVAVPMINGPNVNAGPVAIANVGGSNVQGSNIAQTSAEDILVGAADGGRGMGRYKEARSIRRTKSQSQPQFINSPQATNQGSCSVGTAQCCQSLHQTQDLASQGALGGLLAAGLPLDDLMVGLQCSPIGNLVPVISGSDSCSSQPVCCTGDKYDGLVSVGCSPLSI